MARYLSGILAENQVVLLTMIEPDLKLDVLRSQLDMARESGYMGTSFHGDLCGAACISAIGNAVLISIGGHLRISAQKCNGP